MKFIAILLALVVVASAQGPTPAPPVAPSPGDGGVLAYRFGWADVFCFAGSSTGVPKEFCGLDPPALTRFNQFRALRILYLDGNGNDFANCTDPTSGYDPALIPNKTRSSLLCTDNSYTLPRNDDGWWEYIWNAVGTCVAKGTGMSLSRYFLLTRDTFRRYNPDAALKKNGIDLATASTVDMTQMLDILEKEFGYRGFYTCDTATRSKLNTFSVCLAPTPPYHITKCPDATLVPPSKCPTTLIVGHDNSTAVTPECEKYYPSLTTWPSTRRLLSTWIGGLFRY